MTGNCDYVNKKFGFSKVQWVITNSCVSPPLKDKTFHSPEFYVRGFYLTRWMISVKRCNLGGRNIVKFLLKRLNCPPFDGIVSADCILEYSDHGGEITEIDFNEIFENNMISCTERDMQSAGIIPVDSYHLHDFKLKLEMLISFPDIKESILLCQNLGIRRLSEDLHHLYEDGVMSDLSIRLEDKELKVHKVILLNRITNENIKKQITKDIHVFSLEDFLSEPAEKVISFLYSGNLQYTLDSEPTIGVFKFAEFLGVKPVISYYNPDELKFTSDTDVEEFSTTWTIEEFCNRNDNFLQSPTMTNKKMDMKWRLKVYPKGFSKDNYLDILLDYETKEISKYACVELFLQGGPQGRISFRCHKILCGKGILKTKKFITRSEVLNNYIRDDSLTIGLRLRMYNGKESTSINESKAEYKHFSEQKNYERLSHDILSTYDCGEHIYLRRDFRLEHIILSVHECILKARCISLSDALDKNVEFFDNLNIAAIYEMIHFVYSGKLLEHNLLDDIFDLYSIAKALNFENLKAVIKEKLLKILCITNAREIHQFATREHLQDLRDSATKFL